MMEKIHYQKQAFDFTFIIFERYHLDRWYIFAGIEQMSTGKFVETLAPKRDNPCGWELLNRAKNHFKKKIKPPHKGGG